MAAVAPYRGLTVVADMDGTLVERPPSGLYPSLKDGPCYGPVLRWLQGGGRVVLITSAAWRTRRQFWNCIPLEFRQQGQVQLVLMGGALLLTGNKHGGLEEDRAYRRCALPGGTCLSAEEGSRVLQDMVAVQRRVWALLCSEPQQIDLLSLKYHAPLRERVAWLQATKTPVENFITEELLTTPGAILPNPPEVYFSAACLDEQLRRHCDHPTAVAAPSAAGVPHSNLTLAPPPDVRRTSRVSCDSVYTPITVWAATAGTVGLEEFREEMAELQLEEDARSLGDISMMGIPQKLAPALLDGLREEYAQCGLAIDYAPNSVKVHKHGLDKAAPLRWLAGLLPLPESTRLAQGVSGPCLHDTLKLERSVALGDSPHSNDGPLGYFLDQGMPFVSLANRLRNVPSMHASLHVGQEETGGALFLSHLMDLLDEHRAAHGDLEAAKGQHWQTLVTTAALSARATVDCMQQS